MIKKGQGREKTVMRAFRLPISIDNLLQYEQDRLGCKTKTEALISLLRDKAIQIALEEMEKVE